MASLYLAESRCDTLSSISDTGWRGLFVRVVREAGMRRLSLRDFFKVILRRMDLSKMAVVDCREMSLILLETAARGLGGGEGRADQLLPPISL